MQSIKNSIDSDEFEGGEVETPNSQKAEQNPYTMDKGLMEGIAQVSKNPAY